MNSDNIQYICLKLDDDSKSRLREIVLEIFGSENCVRLFCDHLTLAYGEQVDYFDMNLLGLEFDLSSDEIAYDDKCAALVVDSEQVLELGVNNEHPHITLATFDYATKPVYSNQLLSKEHETVSLPDGFEPVFHGTIVAVERKY